MKNTFSISLFIGILSLSIFSCQKKSDSPAAPDFRQNVVGTYYDTRTTIHINTTDAYNTLSQFTTIPAIFSVNTTVSIGNFNTQFKVSLNPTDGTQVLFTDTNQTNPTTLFVANSFTETSPITTFYVPSQSLSSTLLATIATVPGISGLLSTNLVTIKGQPNFTYNSIGYDGGYNSGSKNITAYGKGTLNITIGSFGTSFDFFTLTITGTKK